MVLLRKKTRGSLAWGLHSNPAGETFCSLSLGSQSSFSFLFLDKTEAGRCGHWAVAHKLYHRAAIPASPLNFQSASIPLASPAKAQVWERNKKGLGIFFFGVEYDSTDLQL